ncbi:MAG: AI-2E family transporter [Caldilineaceae bacterium]|nr:AI-2E family transporter [Caldilineaceae bacterium]MBP8108736.1 AI-2E family transporter [Caldilineaceae bacterium]MBP8124667.1 AI-2E family transporter [Caldilineaceae bacterium]MBP9073919.1 AI-2E family transporter [Caldilineaceae bacterium]
MSFGEFFKRFLAILLVFLLVTAVWAARSTLLLGVAAALIAVGISIPAAWLQRLGMHRGWANALAVLAVTIGATFLVLLVLPRLIAEFGVLLGSIPGAVGALVEGYRQLQASSTFLSAALPALPTAESAALPIDPAQAQSILNQFVSASLAIGSTLLSGMGVVMAVVIDLVFVLFITAFFLVDPDSYIRGSLYLIPQRLHSRALHIWDELYHTAKTWITALSLSIVVTVALVWLVLGVVLGMPNALVVAVFAGLATFVPNVGAFLPVIPIIIFTLATDPTQLLLYLPVYLALQLTESNIISPTIAKAELNIPAGALMLFQLLITLAFGALGLLLAVPIFALLTVLVRELYSYDLLRLRHVQIALGRDEAGQLALLPSEAEPSEQKVVAAPAPPSA